MYRAVRDLKQAGRPTGFVKHWLVLSGVAAALLVFAVTYPALFRPGQAPPSWLGNELAIVGLREIPISKGGAARAPAADEEVSLAEAVSPKRGKKGPAPLFGRLEFQFRIGGSPDIVSVDLRGPREEAISLTTDDTYRLLLEPAADVNVYVFQLSPLGILIRLFPSKIYSPYTNPLSRSQTHYIPPEPNWFYLGLDRGQERMYVLASPEPIEDLESLYSEYTGEVSRSERAQALSRLLGLADTIIGDAGEGASGWVFPFQHR
jgi:hypothetical protein